MIRTSRYSFILAKIYGMLARTWIGENYREILRVRRVQDLFDRLYPGERAEKPEHQLTLDLEARIVRAGIAAMSYVLSSLETPPEILVHMLRKFEYRGVKSAIRVLAEGGEAQAGTASRTAAQEPSGLQVWDLGSYGTIDFGHAGGISAALDASPYAWVRPLLATTPVVRVENMLDQEFYARLLGLARGLPARDRAGVLRLVNLEIALAAVVWALRLRFSFGMDLEKARELLIPGLRDPDRRAVEQSFEIAADSPEAWRRWRFHWLLEDQLTESFKAPDPVRAEQQAARRLYQRAHQLFHQDPFTLTPLAAFFKLKEYEVTYLKTAVEALRLSVPEQDVLSLAGVQ